MIIDWIKFLALWAGMLTFSIVTWIALVWALLHLIAAWT